MAAQRFNFAWADVTETTFGIEHQVEGEKVFSFNIEHQEGDFPAATIVIKNPRIGLLNASRKQWAWLSRESTPLFFGRLIGIPDDINQDTVTLQFIARPPDYAAQKAALAETLRTLPYYDPVFITPDAQADDDTVLEARPEAWHIDRTTLLVTTSHILVGEDGVEEFIEAEVPYDSVKINIGQVPIRNLSVTADVSWTQQASGSIDIGTYYFESYTGKSLVDGWPDPGADLGGGWTATTAYAIDNWNVDNTEAASYSVTWDNPAQKHAAGDTLSTSISSTVAPLVGDSVKIPLTSSGSSGEDGASSSASWLRVPLWSVRAALSASYSASRARKESVAFTLSANFQALLTLPADDEVAQLQVSGGDVGLPLADTSVPIGNLINRTYFSTDRGLRSLEYLILRARSQIMMSSRAVSVTFSCPFDRAIDLSCRMDGLLHDHRIPGGQGVGKITRYAFSCDGDSGELIGSVTIECSIGYGDSIEEVAGEPEYCDTDYCDDDYQFFIGQIVVLDAGDVGYTVPADTTNDDGLHFPLTRGQAVLTNTTHGSVSSQRAALEAFAASFVPPNLSGIRGTQEEIDAIVNRSTEVPQQVNDMLKANSIWQEIKLKNVNGGPFNNEYDITVTDLELPQGIDMEADSTP